ncbi:SPCS1 [Lepeophtheirus salmonis]|uniref:Signal peptidase complex subunit 1 n=2 Tax=Lepeophtheirus salmonis TaxID=72036 RepID=A0A7R8H171_LEPSM|nr:SPCS1 [Lepeophtheirus salmonis]CAF2801583.1 SPCS1 [Lepeophtheirus salmonis]
MKGLHIIKTFWRSESYSVRGMDFLKSIPVHMDFDGQARAEKLSRIIVTLFGAVGLVWGYIIQQFSQTVYILGAGLLLATILTVPPWPLYRLKSLKWQKARPDPTEEVKFKKNK